VGDFDPRKMFCFAKPFAVFTWFKILILAEIAVPPIPFVTNNFTPALEFRVMEAQATKDK